MRGSRDTRALGAREQGIIPAHAGLTRVLRQDDGAARDHPRACGAHWNVRPLRSTSAGSSPRMRGSRGSRRGVRARRGIIPAHAGLTLRTASASR